MKIGIIGYGSMGKMLLWKFSQAGNINKQDLLVSNRTLEKLNEVKGIAVIADSNKELAQKADIVFVCVRPADIKAVLEDIREVLRPDTLIVSLNGNISFETLHKVIGTRTAKVIPSLTAEIGRSQTLVCYDPNVTQQDKDNLKDLLACIGSVIELPEKELGMGSELVSCMPGFIASIFDVICTSAQAHTTIPKEQIVRMVLSTMTATGELMLQKQMTFEDVVSRVATKGGITQEGTSVVYDGFPQVSDQLFEKTLAKRRLIAQRAESEF